MIEYCQIFYWMGYKEATMDVIRYHAKRMIKILTKREKVPVYEKK